MDEKMGGHKDFSFSYLYLDRGVKKWRDEKLFYLVKKKIEMIENVVCINLCSLYELTLIPLFIYIIKLKFLTFFFFDILILCHIRFAGFTILHLSTCFFN